MREEEVTSFSADGTRLAGTLSLPVGTSRAGRVMIRGTGPLDRDENASAKPGQRLDIFKALVASLAASRYASLHYDKRGCGQSSGDYLVHEQADLIADVRASIEELAAQNIGPVVLLGHSEGTIIAPRAAQGRDDVAGIVLVGPFIQPMSTLLCNQAAVLARETREAGGLGPVLRRALIGLLGGFARAQDCLVARLQSSDTPVIRVLGQRQPARSLRDLLALDNHAVHAENQLPTLVLVAGKGAQCPPEDGEAIAALNPQADLIRIDDLSHILRRDSGPPAFARCAVQLGQPVDPAVGGLVGDWLDHRIAPLSA